MPGGRCGPGIGSFAVEALVVSDYAAVQGFVLSMALLFGALAVYVSRFNTSILLVTQYPQAIPTTRCLQHRCTCTHASWETSWADLSADPESGGINFTGWQVDVVKALVSLGKSEDIVVFSHFIALNAAYCAATGADQIIAFRPDNCSVSVFESDGETLKLLKLGHEADTQVT